MPAIPKPLLKLALHLSRVIGYGLLWLTISAVLMLVGERLSQTHYQPGDTPHHAFQVLLLQADSTPSLAFLRDYQPGMPLAVGKSLHGQQQAGHFYKLTQTAANTYRLYADRDTFITTQHYRIDNNRIVPLDFRWRTVSGGFIAALLAIPLLWLVRKGVAALYQRRGMGRHSPPLV